MTTIKQIHLVGAKTRRQMAAQAALMQEAQKAGMPAWTAALDFVGFSGRGVRLRMLTPAEKDRAGADVSKALGEDATVGEFRRARNRECALRCIQHVTAERDLDEAGLAKAKWVRVTMQNLETPTDSLALEKIFTAKDVDALVGWFVAHHDAEVADVEAIMGNEVELAVDGG